MLLLVPHSVIAVTETIYIPLPETYMYNVAIVVELSVDVVFATPLPPLPPLTDTL